MGKFRDVSVWRPGPRTSHAFPSLKKTADCDSRTTHCAPHLMSADPSEGVRWIISSPVGSVHSMISSRMLTVTPVVSSRPNEPSPGLPGLTHCNYRRGRAAQERCGAKIFKFEQVGKHSHVGRHPVVMRRRTRRLQLQTRYRSNPLSGAITRMPKSLTARTTLRLAAELFAEQARDLRQVLEQVADDTVAGNVEYRSVGILVDRDNHTR